MTKHNKNIYFSDTKMIVSFEELPTHILNLPLKVGNFSYPEKYSLFIKSEEIDITDEEL